MAAPIRVGFIGLSKSGWGAGGHLPYLQASPKYKIVAVQNSSVQSAQEAIKLYKLPESTKAYGDPNDIANDPDVDLVVVSVRVDKHSMLASPSLKKGKNVLVEWPLGKNLAEAEELLHLSREGNVKTAAVGLQGRQAPVIAALKKIIKDGTVIGNVLSSSLTTQLDVFGGPVYTENFEFLTRKEVGANLVTIHFGHTVDYLQHVLGAKFKSASSLLANRRPFVTLTKQDGTLISDHHPKTAEDTIFVHGLLINEIPVSMALRSGKPFKGTPGLDWRIHGNKGEIRVTASGPFLNTGYPDLKVEIHDFETDEVTQVQLPKDQWDAGGENELPGPTRNVARLYEAIERGDWESLCSFEDAVERHRFIDELYKQNE